MDFLRTTKVKDIEFSPKGNGLLIYEKNDKIIEVIKGLIENKKISALIVIDKDTVPLRKEQITGIISTLDIVSYVCDHITDNASLSFNLQEIFTDVEKLILNKISVSDVCHESGDAPLFLNDDISILDCLKQLHEHHSRQAILEDSDGNITAYVTQSDIVRTLSKHLNLLESITNNTLRGTGFQLKKVITVAPPKKAIDAFKLIRDNRVSAVGVVDKGGILVGNISASDIKMIEQDARHLPRLFNSVEVFTIKCNQFNNVDGEVVTCSIDDKLESVIQKLSERKIHRIYVVDEKKKPVGVLSVSDLFTLLDLQ